MPLAWQIALAAGAGFVFGVLCAYIACRITSAREPPGRDGHERVGADADGRASGAPQGRPPDGSPYPFTAPHSSTADGPDLNGEDINDHER